MKYRILIVEDEIVSLNMIASILKEDYSVLTASNGEKAFNLYKKFNPHIIITDLKMPVMDGIELIRKIRNIDQNSKIIITTCKNDVDTLLEATELKLFKYIIKPINFTKLKSTISESIDELEKFNTISLNNIKISNNLLWKRDDFELYYNNEVLKLTPKEKKVINTLLFKPNKVFTYNEIIYEVWEKDNDMGDRKTLKNIITGLRKKSADIIIDNVYGFGYKIVII